MSSTSVRFTVILLALATIGFSSIEASVNVSGAITTDTTLGLTFPATDGIYIITGDVTVYNGATLTIEAGVEVRFNQYMSMYIGSGTSIGILNCLGEDGNPVLFTSNQVTHSRGFWYSLFFRVNSDASVLDYTIVEYGGGANSAMVYLENAEPTLNNCTIRESSTYGLRLTGSSAPNMTYTESHHNSSYGMRFEGTSDPTLIDCSAYANASHGIYADTTGSPEIIRGSFSSNTGYGIYCAANTCLMSIAQGTFNDNTSVPLRIGANQLGLLTDASFSGNVNSYIEVISATVILDSTWQNHGIPYVMTGEVYIQGKHGPDMMTTVTIEPGTTIQFNGVFGIYVGHDSSADLPGSLIANANGASPITFTRFGASLYWSGIYYADFSHDFSCVLDNCILEYGGYNSTGGRDIIYCNLANPKIRNSIIRNSQRTGVNCVNSSPEISGCTITANSGYAVDCNNGSPQILNNNLVSNSNTAIYIRYGNADPIIQGNTITGNSGYGVYCYDSTNGPIIEDNTITGNTGGYTIYGIYGRYVYQITGNTLDKDLYVVADTLTEDAVWEGQDTYYYMSGGFTVYGKSGADLVTSLTLLEGAKLKFPGSTELIIGHNSDANYPGRLVTMGTEARPVKITSTSMTGPSQWGDLYFSYYADFPNCQLNYTVIEYGGQYWYPNNHHMVHVNGRGPTIAGPYFNNCTIQYSGYNGFYAANAAPVLNGTTVVESAQYNILWETCNGEIVDSIVSDSASGYHNIYFTGNNQTIVTGNIIANAGNYGIYCAAAGTAPTINSNSFIGNASHPIYMYARNVWKIGVPLNSYLFNGGANRIYVVGDTINLDSYWYDQVTSYFISGDVTIQGQDGADTVTTLTIQQGSDLYFNSQAGLWIGSNTSTSPGALVAVGGTTPSDRILFTGSTLSAGYWDGIYFYNYADDAICLLENCDVMYGGYSSNENIYCYSSSPTFKNCKFYYGSGYNVLATTSANPIIQNCEIAYTSGQGLVSSTNSNPQVTGTTIRNNTSYGIYVVSTSTATITNSIITANSSYGLYCNSTGDAPIVTNCEFTNNTTYPIYIYARNVKGITGCTYSGNTNEYIHVIGDTIITDSYWEKVEPYYIAGGVTVQGMDGTDSVTTLTLQPGSQLRFGSQVLLYIGHDSSTTLPGGLMAVGSELEPITFTAHTASPSPGYWSGIYFARYSNNSLCQLEYCTVSHGGYSTYENIYCNYSSPTLTNCSIQYGSGPNVYALNTANPTFIDCNIGYGTSHGVYVNTNSGASLSGTTIHHHSDRGVHLANTSTATINDCVIANNVNYGVSLAAAVDSVTITNSTFTNNTGYPIYVFARHVKNILGCTYSGNSNELIYVVGDTISLDSYWENPEPYFITGDVLVRGLDGADLVTTLTLEPGARLEFNSLTQLIIGDNSAANAGALMAVGTAAEPIVFTARTGSPSPGYWDGIYFYDYASDDSLLTYCNVLYGGYDVNENVHCYNSSPTLTNCTISYGAGVNVYAQGTANPTITNCDIGYATAYGVQCNSGGHATITGSTIRNSSTYGVYVVNTSSVTVTDTVFNQNNWGLYCNAAADSATVTGCSFTNNTNYPIRMYASKVPGVTNCTYTGNQNQLFYVYGDTISLDSYWHNQGIPYYVDPSAHIYVQGQDGADSVTTWTLEPGTVVKVYNVMLYIGHDTNPALPGAIVAEGTSAQKIVFTSWKTTPAAGDWTGFYFAGYASDELCSMRHCVVEYGGQGSVGNIRCNGSIPTFEDCEISYGASYGIRTTTADADAFLTNCYIHDNTSIGVYASPGIAHVFGGIIENHPTYGVYINESTAGAPSAIINRAIVRNNRGGYGFYIEGSPTTPVISACVISGNNSPTIGYGVFVTGSALPIIGGPDRADNGGNDFSNHLSYAVYNNTATTCINAQDNYWGQPGGPLDTGFGIDGCLDTGNNNLGAERVSDDVDYRYWTNSPYTPTPTPTNSPTVTPTVTTTPIPPTETPVPCVNDGDVNNDLEITIEDAQLAYMITLGIFTPTHEESCSADCNSDDSVTMADAQCMFMYYLGLPCACTDPIAMAFYLNFGKFEGEDQDAAIKEQRGELLELTTAPAETLLQSIEQNDLVWIADVSGCSEQVIEVPIGFSNPNNAIDAFGFTVEYDASMLEYTGFNQGTGAADWVFYGGNEVTPGEIRVAGFSLPAGALASGSEGTLITLTFKVKCEACERGASSDFTLKNLTDDLSEWNGLSGSFTYCQVVSPDSISTLEGRILWMPLTEQHNHLLQ